MRWANIPIPEGHLISLILGILLQVFIPRQLLNAQWLSINIGVPLIVAGLLLVGWSVYAVREIDVEKPDHVITHGPYALSRNPMYVAWSLIYLAITFMANSTWLVMLFPLVLLYTHFFAILPEEKRLEDQFRTEYLAYKSRVRRYL